MCKTVDREGVSYARYYIRTAVKIGQMVSETTPKTVNITSRLSRLTICHFLMRGMPLIVLEIDALTHCSVQGDGGV
jgi:hypothetical protein